MMKLLQCLALAFLILGSSMGAALSAREPGDIIQRERMADAPPGVTAWRVRYVTGGRSGVPQQEATGVILVPSDNGGGQPLGIVAWTHGTWGVASKCAPSQSEDFFDLTPAVSAVGMGYVVVAPDYTGLGTADNHPYLIGQPAGQSVIDAIRAARDFREFNTSGSFVVWGESQGGHAALWTAMIASDAPDLTLLGVAAGAPPTDLAANFRGASDPNARAFLTALTADSWSRYFDHKLAVGKRRTPAIIRKLASNCISAKPRFGALVGMLALRQDLKNYDFASQQPWAKIMSENSVRPNFSAPLLIAQTREDPLVSPQVTRAFASSACGRGLSVKWIDLPGKDHATTASQSAVETLQWINDRFGGRAAQDDCAAIR